MRSARWPKGKRREAGEEGAAAPHLHAVEPWQGLPLLLGRVGEVRCQVCQRLAAGGAAPRLLERAPVPPVQRRLPLVLVPAQAPPTMHTRA